MSTPRRKTHCPQGRPMYRAVDVPAGLVTITDLYVARRTLAPGQQPVATLFYHGNQHTGLYALADTVELPRPTGKRLQTWTANRTCVRCAEVSTGRPWPLWGDRRLCPSCIVAEHLAEHRPRYLGRRAEATAWARQVLADPAAGVMACITDGWGEPARVHAATFDGQVLADLLITDDATATEAVERLDALVGRRFVHHVAKRDGHGWNTDSVTPANRVLEKAPYARGDWDERQRVSALCAAGTDAVQPRLTQWMARQRPPVYVEQGLTSGYGLLDADVSPAPTAAALAATLRALVRQIADDDHPDGPATCPVLPPTGVTPCGATILLPTGTCPDHGSTT